VIGHEQAEALIRAAVSPRLADHCLGVAQTAATLARRWHADESAAFVAGALHDYCRERRAEEVLAAARNQGIDVGTTEERYPLQLLHGPLAAAELAHLDVDATALKAIAVHTVGCAGMSILDKCVYVADSCEPGRSFPGVDEIRMCATESLDGAVELAVARSIVHVVERGRPLAVASVLLYNEVHGAK
jgi:predicted HD superfamily hydrolase involved in NAD metabolism